MPDFIQDFDLPITCPICGKETVQKYTRLKQNPQITCSGCGTVIDINADDLRAALDSIEKQLQAFRRKFT